MILIGLIMDQRIYNNLAGASGYGNGNRQKNRWRLMFAFSLVLLLLFLAVALFVINELYQRQQIAEKLRLQNQPEVLIDQSLMNEIKENLGASTTTSTTTPTSTSVVKNQTRQTAEKLDRPQSGNPEASLVIVEFGDFNCPVCAQAYSAIRTIANKYSQDVLFIYRQYPVIDDNSTLLAQTSLCAWKQNKFWQFHDKMFAGQKQITTTDDLKKILLSAGINLSQLETCLKDEAINQLVVEDVADALDLGVRGTPTFFINGSKLEGNVAISVWEEIIKKHKELTK